MFSWRSKKDVNIFLFEKKKKASYQELWMPEQTKFIALVKALFSIQK